MSNIVFFSFKEKDRQELLLIKGRAHNPLYMSINFNVRDLLKRWKTDDPARIKQAITMSMKGTSRTIVFVGKETHKSYWVPHEVLKTIQRKKKVFAIFLEGKEDSIVPQCLIANNIHVYKWSESRLQELVQR